MIVLYGTEILGYNTNMTNSGYIRSSNGIVKRAITIIIAIMIMIIVITKFVLTITIIVIMIIMK